MARRIADKNLDSKDARRKLQPRGKPYWRSVERGLHLGYRRLREGAGPWIARRYVGAQRYDEQAIGIADDLSDADGVRVLSYWQAVDLARGTSAKEDAAHPLHCCRRGDRLSGVPHPREEKRIHLQLPDGRACRAGAGP